MTAEEEIEQVLSGPEPDMSETPTQAFSPEDREAMYLMRRLHKLRVERQRIVDLYKAVQAELDERRGGQVGPIDNTIDWLTQRLALWHHARLLENPDALSVQLPTGTLTSSKAQPRWVYDDEELFLKWAGDHADAAIRKPEPREEIDKNAAKKVLGAICEIREGKAVVKETGEFVPGLRIEPGGDYELGRFYRVTET